MADTPLNVGDIAPDFTLLNQDKNPVRLWDYRGKKKVMLLFYPMDFSPICTQEHCTFGPSFDKLNGPDAQTVIFGVSTDSPFCHAAFRKQYNIPYDLLADTSRKVSKAYNLFAGEEPYNCSKRGTVVIDKSGRIAVWQEVGTKHVRQVEELSQQLAYDIAMGERYDQFGESTSSSR